MLKCSNAGAGKIKTEAFRRLVGYYAVINIVGVLPRLIAMCQISKQNNCSDYTQYKVSRLLIYQAEKPTSAARFLCIMFLVCEENYTNPDNY